MGVQIILQHLFKIIPGHLAIGWPGQEKKIATCQVFVKLTIVHAGAPTLPAA